MGVEATFQRPSRTELSIPSALKAFTGQQASATIRRGTELTASPCLRSRVSRDDLRVVSRSSNAETNPRKLG